MMEWQSVKDGLESLGMKAKAFLGSSDNEAAA